MKDQRLLIYEGIREKAYQLIAGCYVLPEAGIFEQLDDLETALTSVCPDAAEFVAAMRAETPIDELEIDYTKLMVGPYKVPAPPYGSIYLDNTRTVMGPSTTDVRNRYQAFGLDISENFKDAPDHINAELEFMYYLIFQQIEAIKESDIESALAYLAAQRSFLEDHLGAWVAEFTARIEKHAETDFYKCLASLTRIFVHEDLENISEVSLVNLTSSSTEG